MKSGGKGKGKGRVVVEIHCQAPMCLLVLLTMENLIKQTWRLVSINILAVCIIQICILEECASNLDKCGVLDGLKVLSTIVFQFISLLTLYKGQ